MQSFFGLTLKDLEAAIGSLGKEKFRARQLYTWIYTKSVFDFQEMTNIPEKPPENLSGHVFHEIA